MRFNLFGKKKHLKELKSKGGMSNIYSTLINEIKSLGETYNSKFNVILNNLDKNKYGIIIDFSNMRDSIIAYSDTFVLIEEPNNLKVDWIRHSKSKIPILPSPLREKIRESFLFSKNEDQKEIFKNLIQKINEVLNQKYQFSDSHYERIEKSGNSEYISKEEMMKLQAELSVHQMQQIMNNQNDDKE